MKRLFACAFVLAVATYFSAQSIKPLLAGSQQMQGSGSKPVAGKGPDQTAVVPPSDPTKKLIKVVKTEQQWREQLSPMEFYVARQKGTERPFTNAFWDNKKNGQYVCKCCDLLLFDSKHKFKSGTGWPSYNAVAKAGHVGTVVDRSAGMERTEVVCNRCGAHLGHVFKDGPRPTGLRYCINSASLGFKARKFNGSGGLNGAGPIPISSEVPRSPRVTMPSAGSGSK